MTHLSISSAVKETKYQYGKAFLMPEYDNNNPTYFINYSLKSTELVFQKLLPFKDEKKIQGQKIYEMMISLVKKGLNPAQAECIASLYVKGGKITTKEYSTMFYVVRQTIARHFDQLDSITLTSCYLEYNPRFIELTSKDVVLKFMKQTSKP